MVRTGKNIDPFTKRTKVRLGAGAVSCQGAGAGADDGPGTIFPMDPHTFKGELETPLCRPGGSKLSPNTFVSEVLGD